MKTVMHVCNYILSMRLIICVLLIIDIYNLIYIYICLIHCVSTEMYELIHVLHLHEDLIERGIKLLG